MTEIFGHRWASTYGDQDSGTWLQGLGGLTPEQVAHGLGVVMEVGEEWPPSLPSFRKMCLGKHESEKNGFGLDYVPQYYHKAKDSNGDEVKKITNAATDETRKAALEACRGILPRGAGSQAK